MRAFFTKIVFVGLLSATLPIAHANQDSQIEQIRSDKDYHTNVAKARNMLQARGYRVQDIRAYAENGTKYLDIEAYKGASKYAIKLYYPNLNIAKEKLEK